MGMSNIQCPLHIFEDALISSPDPLVKAQMLGYWGLKNHSKLDHRDNSRSTLNCVIVLKLIIFKIVIFDEILQ